MNKMITKEIKNNILSNILFTNVFKETLTISLEN